MPPPRPRGVGYNTGVATSRPSPNTPMSERQQMALLIQMTANSTTEASRTHIKKNEHKKGDDVEDVNSTEKHDHSETSRDKLTTDEGHTENKIEHDGVGSADTPSSSQGKRHFSDIDEDEFEECDEGKKKKRKEIDGGKDAKSTTTTRLPGRTEKVIKQTSASKGSPNPNKNANSTEKDQTELAKSGFGKQFETEGDDEELKMSESLYSGGLKVPPLKIVIPQQNCSIDTDGNVSRTGKINTSRNAALPYVVSSNTNDSNEREAQCGSPHESPIKINNLQCNIIDEKNLKLLNEEKNLHRVLRSSHRSGITSTERSSNNSSPQMQSSSPSPASSNANEGITDNKLTFTNVGASPLQHNHTYENENIVNLPSPSTSSTSSSKDVHSHGVELHPRKRKIRTKHDDNHNNKNNGNQNTNTEANASMSDTHSHDMPFTNCFQMYLRIRRQIEKKWQNMYPIKPRPPQGYNEYLLNKKNYLLASNEKKIEFVTPSNIPPKMQEIYRLQENERQALLQRHIVEREKLCLNVEQEMIRVHSKAARNISCQPVPYSVCTLLKDEEVYNIPTSEQDEKDKNARYRFNGRQLLSWLQDVDDKWDKIKEAMVLRHHNEAESLHAVQMMDWDIALKKHKLWDYKCETAVDKDHVPIVHVSDDFDLLPA
ncbi:PREDICTED: ankyrin repeat domain-containing protein 12 [Bactrocera latifrons]|uniref:Ankyrin repeat domain-containing protein 11 n=1 Tax=Bactrocera latifrons TaxID=174628 RepID=A0A0K8U2R7_BACLA|nr:PREDICTED: ankyrin repeat domain-containing protein 12 [Bactrocera latifrons]